MALPARVPEKDKRALQLVHSAQKRLEPAQLHSSASGDVEAGALEHGAAQAEHVDEASEQVSGAPLETSTVRASEAPQQPSEPRIITQRIADNGPAPSSKASPVSEREDSELVVLARSGDSAAFEALYRRHAPYALALTVRVQGHAQDIEDIVHDAFLKVHDRLEDLRSDASFRPWLSRIVVSLVRTKMRRRRFFGVLGLSSDDPIDLEALVAADASPETRAQLAQIYAVLREVPIDQSICWVLRYVEGRKLEEVAEVAGCSLATAKRRIAHVHERLCAGDLRLQEGASDAL